MLKKFIDKIMPKLYKCRKCGEYFTKPEKVILSINWQKIKCCPKCEATQIDRV